MDNQMAKANLGCNVLVFNDRHQLLLGLRKTGKGVGTYGLPGGHVGYGERLIDAAARELKEECGITATGIKFASVIDDELAQEKYIQVNFVVYAYAGTVRANEPDNCGKWEWFPLDDLPERIFLQHLPVIEAYRKRLSYCY